MNEAADYVGFAYQRFGCQQIAPASFPTRIGEWAAICGPTSSSVSSSEGELTATHWPVLVADAFQWMIDRENPKLPTTPVDPAEQFWIKRLEQKTNTSYWLNVATQTPQSELPQLGRGGIIADGMGLGKY